MTAMTQPRLRALTEDQVAYYHEHGFLHLPQMFTPAEMDALDAELTALIEMWSTRDQGWTGDWRKEYMDHETEQLSQLIHLHDLHFYSQAWTAAVTHARLCDAMADLLGPTVELHHTTLHAKPPETGHPFPMHQDWAFYKHTDNRYVDVLVHLDDTNDENGCIRFLDASHKLGALDHITRTADGEPCTPYLDTRQYRLEDTVPVPARRGDVVCFNIHTIHGSHINRTRRIRRMVRVGYRAPDDAQYEGQSLGRPSLMVRGVRPRIGDAQPFSTECRG